MFIHHEFFVRDHEEGTLTDIKEFLFSKQKLLNTEYIYQNSSQFIDDSSKFNLLNLEQLTFQEAQQQLLEGTNFLSRYTKQVALNNLNVGGPFWKGSFLFMLNTFVSCCNGYVRLILQSPYLDKESVQFASQMGEGIQRLLSSTQPLEAVNQNKIRKHAHDYLYQSFDYFKGEHYRVYFTLLDLGLLLAKTPLQIVQVFDAQDFQLFEDGELDSCFDKKSLVYKFQKYWVMDITKLEKKLLKHVDFFPSNFKSTDSQYTFQLLQEFFKLLNLEDGEILNKIIFDNTYKDIAALFLVYRWKTVLINKDNLLTAAVVDLNVWFMFVSEIQEENVSKHIHEIQSRVIDYLTLPFEELSNSPQDFKLWLKSLNDSCFREISQTKEYVNSANYLSFSFEYLKYITDVHEYMMGRSKQLKYKLSQWVCQEDSMIVAFCSLLSQCKSCFYTGSLIITDQQDIDYHSKAWDGMRTLEAIQYELLISFTKPQISYPLKAIWYMEVPLNKNISQLNIVLKYVTEDLLQIIIGEQTLPNIIIDGKERPLNYLELYRNFTVFLLYALDNQSNKEFKDYIQSVVDFFFVGNKIDLVVKKYQSLLGENIMEGQAYGHFVCRFFKRVFSQTEADYIPQEIGYTLLTVLLPLFVSNGFTAPKIFEEVIFNQTIETLNSKLTQAQINLVCYGRDENACDNFQFNFSTHDDFLKGFTNYFQQIKEEQEMIKLKLGENGSHLCNFFNNMLRFRCSYYYNNIQSVLVNYYKKIPQETTVAIRKLQYEYLSLTNFHRIEKLEYVQVAAEAAKEILPKITKYLRFIHDYLKNGDALQIHDFLILMFNKHYDNTFSVEQSVDDKKALKYLLKLKISLALTPKNVLKELKLLQRLLTLRLLGIMEKSLEYYPNKSLYFSDLAQQGIQEAEEEKYQFTFLLKLILKFGSKMGTQQFDARQIIKIYKFVSQINQAMIQEYFLNKNDSDISLLQQLKIRILDSDGYKQIITDGSFSIQFWQHNWNALYIYVQKTLLSGKLIFQNQRKSNKFYFSLFYTESFPLHQQQNLHEQPFISQIYNFPNFNHEFKQLENETLVDKILKLKMIQQQELTNLYHFLPDHADLDQQIYDQSLDIIKQSDDKNKIIQFLKFELLLIMTNRSNQITLRDQLIKNELEFEVTYEEGRYLLQLIAQLYYVKQYEQLMHAKGLTFQDSKNILFHLLKQKPQDIIQEEVLAIFKIVRKILCQQIKICNKAQKQILVKLTCFIISTLFWNQKHINFALYEVEQIIHLIDDLMSIQQFSSICLLLYSNSANDFQLQNKSKSNKFQVAYKLWNSVSSKVDYHYILTEVIETLPPSICFMMIKQLLTSKDDLAQIHKVIYQVLETKYNKCVENIEQETVKSSEMISKILFLIMNTYLCASQVTKIQSVIQGLINQLSKKYKRDLIGITTNQQRHYQLQNMIQSFHQCLVVYRASFFIQLKGNLIRDIKFDEFLQQFQAHHKRSQKNFIFDTQIDFVNKNQQFLLDLVLLDDQLVQDYMDKSRDFQQLRQQIGFCQFSDLFHQDKLDAFHANIPKNPQLDQQSDIITDNQNLEIEKVSDKEINIDEEPTPINQPNFNSCDIVTLEESLMVIESGQDSQEWSDESDEIEKPQAGNNIQAKESSSDTEKKDDSDEEDSDQNSSQSSVTIEDKSGPILKSDKLKRIQIMREQIAIFKLNQGEEKHEQLINLENELLLLTQDIDKKEQEQLLRFADLDFYNSLPLSITSNVKNFNTEIINLQIYILDNLHKQADWQEFSDSSEDGSYENEDEIENDEEEDEDEDEEQNLDYKYQSQNDLDTTDIQTSIKNLGQSMNDNILDQNLVNDLQFFDFLFDTARQSDTIFIKVLTDAEYGIKTPSLYYFDMEMLINTEIKQGTSLLDKDKKYKSKGSKKSNAKKQKLQQIETSTQQIGDQDMWSSLLLIDFEIYDFIFENIVIGKFEIPQENRSQNKGLKKQQFESLTLQLGDVLNYFYKLHPLNAKSMLKVYHFIQELLKQIKIKSSDECSTQLNDLTMILLQMHLNKKKDFSLDQNFTEHMFNYSALELEKITNKLEINLHFDSTLLEILLDRTLQFNSESQQIEEVMHSLTALIEKKTIKLTKGSLQSIIQIYINKTHLIKYCDDLFSTLQRRLKDSVSLQATTLECLHQIYQKLMIKLKQQYQASFNRIESEVLQSNQVINAEYLYQSGTLQLFSDITLNDFEFNGIYSNVYNYGSTFWEIFKSCGEGIHKANYQILIPLYQDFYDMLQIITKVCGDTKISTQIGYESESAECIIKNLLDAIKRYFRGFFMIYMKISKDTPLADQDTQISLNLKNFLHNNDLLLSYYLNLDHKYLSCYFHVLKKIEGINLESLITIENCINFSWQTIKRLLEDQIGDETELTLDIERGKELDYVMQALQKSKLVEFIGQNWFTTFIGESGADHGGLTQDLITNLMIFMNDESRGLFLHTNEYRRLYPNILSKVIPDYKTYYTFYGLVIAKALVDNYIVGIGISNFVLKQLYGSIQMGMEDLKEYDDELSKNLQWLLDNPVGDMGVFFVSNEFILGNTLAIDLLPDGDKLLVTDENKKEYVQRIIQYKLVDSIKDQIDSLKLGFQIILPTTLQILPYKQIQEIIEGSLFINIDDMKSNISYQSFPINSQVIVWFWEILAEMSQKELSELVYFITSSYRLPKVGFKEIQIVLQFVNDGRSLPVSHTCSNQLDVYGYLTKEEMKDKLFLAMQAGHAFGYA